MSTVNQVFAKTRKRTLSTRQHIVRYLFKDYIGLTLFLGALVFFMLNWRIHFFINDNIVIANTLAGVREGHLYIDTVVYGSNLGKIPGSYRVSGHLYGRDYGMVFLSLPFLWLLEGLAHVADPRIAIYGLWSLILLAFIRQIGIVIHHEQELTLLGCAITITLFTANIAFATPLASKWFPLMALQLSTMVVAALCGVVLYRLLACMYNRQLGVAGGAAVILASPVAFWAPIPKRHIPMAALALGTLYCFYRSRSATTSRDALRFRAFAYGCIGVSTWVNAPEALVLLIAVGPIDVLTARTNHPRQLIIVGSVFAISLLPFLITNTMISGNPLRPPSELMINGGIPDQPASNPGSSAGSHNGGTLPEANGSTPLTILQPLIALAGSIIGKFSILTSRFSKGITDLIRDPGQLYYIFIRSGRIPGVRYSIDGQQTVELTILETTPILGVFLGLPIFIMRRLRSVSSFREYTQKPTVQTDFIAISYVILLTLIYLPALPIHAMVTVRYLVPTIPFAIYGVCRLSAVRRAITSAPHVLSWTYAVSVLIGGQFAVVLLVLEAPTPGEAFQLHALCGLSFAVLLGLWIICELISNRQWPRLGAALLAVAAASTTVFILLARWEYFAMGNSQALAITRLLAEGIQII